MLCETNWQQTMGGQGHCKHARETKSKRLFNEYKKGSFEGKWFVTKKKRVEKLSPNYKS